MKKLLIGLTATTLSAAMLVSLVGCSDGGALAKAKSIKGDEVTQEQWSAALSEISEERVAQEPAETGTANFAVSYESNMSLQASSEGVSFGSEEVIAAQSSELEAHMTAQIVVVDVSSYLALEYHIKVSGSEEVREKLYGMGGSFEESGKVEIYATAEGDAAGTYVKVNGGAWSEVNAFMGINGIAKPVLYQISVLLDSFASYSAYATQFKDFIYSTQEKGYVYKTQEEYSGQIVIKIKNEKLAAVLQEISMSEKHDIGSIKGSISQGMVFTFGGQSITAPEV